MLDLFAFLKGVCVAPDSEETSLRWVGEQVREFKTPQARALRRNESCEYWLKLIDEMKNEHNDLSDLRAKILNHLKEGLTGLHPEVTYAIRCTSDPLSGYSLNLIIIPESCAYNDDNPTKCNRRRFCAYDFLAETCHPVQD